MKRKPKKSSQTAIIAIIIILIIVIPLIIYFVNNPTKEKILQPNTTETNEKEEKKDTTQTEEDNNDNSSSKEEEQKKEQIENQEPSKEYTYETPDGTDEVKIEANKVVEATGFSGASNYKFYLRGTTLYFNDISDNNDEEIIAYNVKDLYLEKSQVTAELYSDGNVVKENNYITYKK